MRSIRFGGVRILVVGLILSVTGGVLASEKKFPAKPVQIIIPFQPGSTDILLRPFVEKMPEYLGQPVTFIYKPGAAGSMGAGFVAAAKSDGYTLLGTSISSIVVVPLTQKDLPYTWRSFAPIACMVDVPNMLCVKADARWKDLKEFVAEAKKNPGKISYTSSGTFGSLHISAESFFKEADIKMNHIPSQGSAPSVTAVLGGHVEMNYVTAGVVYPHLKAGTMRALTVFSKKRVKFLPEVPTATELGYPVVKPSYYGILAPKGTPKEIVEAIYLSAKKALENHEAFIQDRFEKMSVQLDFRGPEDYTALLKDQEEFYSDMLHRMRK
jgi:tripartite-type tricarboxylate transporter receptor subunit TctC